MRQWLSTWEGEIIVRTRGGNVRKLDLGRLGVFFHGGAAFPGCCVWAGWKTRPTPATAVGNKGTYCGMVQGVLDNLAPRL